MVAAARVEAAADLDVEPLDGLIELTAPSGEMFGSRRLTEVLTAAAGEPLESACDRLFARVAAHAGGRAPQDDITLLAVEYRGG